MCFGGEIFIVPALFLALPATKCDVIFVSNKDFLTPWDLVFFCSVLFFVLSTTVCPHPCPVQSAYVTLYKKSLCARVASSFMLIAHKCVMMVLLFLKRRAGCKSEQLENSLRNLLELQIHPYFGCGFSKFVI